ncbi:MAG: DUF4416 family protein [Candidatus Sabulitectum sp.]|nr:DUF4416 family protein [Candidatus Sabulitectum sp.]
MYNDCSLLKETSASLQLFFGEVVLFSEPCPFDMTDYYRDEMGSSILRVWFCFSPLRDPSELPLWKEKCMEIEEKFGERGKRLVNIDPGYLDHGKLQGGPRQDLYGQRSIRPYLSSLQKRKISRT